MCCRDALLLPLWSSAGSLLGVLAVCGELSHPSRQAPVREAMISLPVLAGRIAFQLERGQMEQRLNQAQRAYARAQRTTSRTAARSASGLPIGARAPEATSPQTPRHQQRPAS
jgi:hypothetical protein